MAVDIAVTIPLAVGTGRFPQSIVIPAAVLFVCATVGFYSLLGESIIDDAIKSAVVISFGIFWGYGAHTPTGPLLAFGVAVLATAANAIARAKL